ncbi:FkbM family methyltransferase [Asticcacaulis taihuensis]|uniref:Methyltransferase, FkbM family n=1 Tax=Asticcacaulis taihuensis TaxID=260084 RepID=A0A1G4SGW4_9CAUL|nr:FkbM family methyltransferase [Asticcacaulis taihuensis]SCW67559.1 methyltransferase, FkbM family [Asticcacaulis taihuensis]
MFDLKAYMSELDANGIHFLNEMLTQYIAGKIIKPGNTVYDLGANIGFHTRYFASLTGNAGMVHAFEPNFELWANLMALPGVRLWPLAIGDRTSVENFFLPIGLDQVGSLVDARDFLGDVPVKILSVSQVRIDDLKEVIGVPVSFVKIDVERREYFALNGMLETLKNYEPVLIFENNTADTQHLLEGIGYTVEAMLSDFQDVRSLPNVIAFPNRMAKTIREILPSDTDIVPIAEKIEAMLAANLPGYQAKLIQA